MDFRPLFLLGSIAACAVFLPAVASASEDDDLEYARGYEHCRAGGGNDSDAPSEYQEGCDDALEGRRSRLDDGSEASAQAGQGLDQAIQACRQRSVEGSRYDVDDTQVLQVTQVGADRYHLDIKSPAGNIRCAVSTEGEVFSADEI